MNIYKSKILPIVFLLLIIQLRAQNYNFRNFSLKEGLSDAIVTSIVQNEDGFLYFTTQNGLSKFDGKKSTNYDKSNGLPDNYIESAILYQNNKLLLATHGGLSIFNDGKFKNFTKANGLSSDTVNTIFKDNNRFLVGTNLGVSIFKNDSFLQSTEFNILKNLEILAFEQGNNNSLFIGTNKGLFKKNDKKIIYIKKSFVVYDLQLNIDGSLLCATNDGLYHYKNNNLIKDENIQAKNVYSIKIDNLNQIWLGTDEGIEKLSNNTHQKYNVTNFFKGRYCYDVFQDRELNLWFATNHGVYIFDDEKFILYDRRNGISSSVWGFLERKNGEFWVATDGNKVLKFENNKFVEIPYLSKLSKTVWTLFEDKNKNVWFSTASGVSRLDANNQLTHYSSKNGFTDDMIIGITDDKMGNLWFSSFKSGVYKYNGKTFTNISLKNAGQSPIFAAVTGCENCLWFISGAGIDRIENSKPLDFPKQEILNLYGYYSISIDRKNNIILLGSIERGLIIYNPNEKDTNKIVKFISTESGLSDNAVYFTEFDDNDSTLWIGTTKGVNKLDYKNYIKSGKIEIKTYNSYDGFPSSECHQFGSYIDSKGNFWFATSLGVVKYDKKKEISSKFSSTPFISSIEINYKNINLAEFGVRNEDVQLKYENVEFPHDMNNITIHFSSIYFTNPLDILYSYRLVGSNDAFSPLTRNQTITFSSLNPGKYTFELISFTHNGKIASDPITFSFEIETPFWQSSLFYGIIILVFLLIVYVIYRVRIASVRKKNLELMKLYRENLSYQKQLLESEKDYKGLFENAHNAILIIDISTLSIIDANSSAKNLYGYENEELINLSASILCEDSNNITDLVEKVVTNNGVRKYKATHFKKDGTKIILSINAGLTNYKGKLAIVSIHRDITEEEETKELLLVAKDVAEKSNKLKSEFLAQISHEIRTPINTILGYVSLLKESFTDNDDSETNSLFLPIQRSTKRIMRTIDLILNMSEVNSGTFDLTIQELDIAEIINFIVIEQNNAAKEKGLKLTFTNNIENKTLSVDEYTFTQIFVNLIDNAIKYTNEGSIDVILSKIENKIIAEIKDTGIGISDEFLPILFEAFSQEEHGYTRKYDGNGLGLALVKNYVKINNGTISVESIKGKGTTFKVEFNI